VLLVYDSIPNYLPSRLARSGKSSTPASSTANFSLAAHSCKHVALSRNSSQTSSVAVLNRHEAAAWAMESPALRICAPAADNAPPYRFMAVVKSMRSSPDLASALPESMSGIAAGFNEKSADDDVDDREMEEGKPIAKEEADRNKYRI